MKKSLLYGLLCASVLVTTSCNRNRKTFVPGNVTTKEIAIGDYKAIESVVPVNIEYEQKAGPAYLKFEADKDLIDELSAEVKDSVLQLQFKAGIPSGFTPQKAVVHTNSARLILVSMNGAGNLTFKGPIKGKMLDVRINGAGNFDANDLQCTSLALSVNGAGNANVKGNVEAASYNMNGAGNVDAKDLVTTNLRVFLNGAGNATVNTKDYLSVNLKGVGNVKYVQKPKKIETDIQGVGKVTAE